MITATRRVIVQLTDIDFENKLFDSYSRLIMGQDLVSRNLTVIQTSTQIITTFFFYSAIAGV